MGKFLLKSKLSPSGDQPQAINTIVRNLNNGIKHQTLWGATGTGKTFTMAKVIENINKPVLVLANNKTLAAQLYNEFKELFPCNAVEYFVSYFDYYQPEAYISSRDIYIEKETMRNAEIEKLRYSAVNSLIQRKDVIVVSSVSCIYGAGDSEMYREMAISLKINQQISRDLLIEELIEIQYLRNDYDFSRSSFRVRGDIIDIIPSWDDKYAIRIIFFDDNIENILLFNPLTGEISKKLDGIMIYPASHFVAKKERLLKSIDLIRKELNSRLKGLKNENKMLEAQRLEQRTNYDLELLSEVGTCPGIENYSRHLSLKKEGETPFTLFDYFPKDFLMFIDESHVSIPQVKGMFNGDRSRKEVLVENGFRLPSALDHRPLNFKEFEEKIKNVVYVSATPGEYELNKSKNNIVNQIIRPTGLLDPKIEIYPIKNQIFKILEEIKKVINRKERVFLITLTIRMAEELTNFLNEKGIKVAYLHSEIKNIERLSIINDFRLGKYDVLVGINLLREGLDIPEVSLVLILDADKEGFLRSTTSLIQNIGRAARNQNGKVILFADHKTKSIEEAVKITNNRRKLQEKFNKENKIIPQTIKKKVYDTIIVSDDKKNKNFIKDISIQEKEKLKIELEKKMKKAAKDLDFEKAAMIRDELIKLTNN